MSEEWYYLNGQERCGPVTLDALRQQRISGALRPDQFVCQPGMPAWVAAGSVPQLGFEVSPSAGAFPAGAVSAGAFPAGGDEFFELFEFHRPELL